MIMLRYLVLDGESTVLSLTQLERSVEACIGGQKDE